MRKILSYVKSHIYDIHAIVVATIVVGIMYIIKRPIKRRISLYVEKKAKVNPSWNEKKRLYLKRGNMLVLLTAVVLALLLFAVVALVSPFIRFSVPTACMSVAFTLAEYACIDQLELWK